MRQDGFTLIELIVVIVIIGILLSITTFTQTNVLAASRDSERVNDVASMARLLEDGYINQTAGSPSYPSITSFVSDAKNASGLGSSADPGMFRTPNALASSVTGATTTATTNPAGANTPTTSQYVYQPLTAAGGLCVNTTDTCVRFRLYFRSEDGGKVAYARSAHQQ